MSGRRAPHLRPGDRVAVVAPSGPIPAGRFEAGCAWLRTLGLDVVVGKHTGDDTGYLAGADADRAGDLQRAWCDPTVAAVVCAGGGYGATRLLPLLDWAELAAAGPKLLHGSSDITALHVAFAHRLGAVTTFGPMPASLVITDGEPEPTSSGGVAAVWFDGTPVTLEGTTVLSGPSAYGTLAGGNLALLAATTGTGYAAPCPSGGIALLEDVGEEPYRVDRMATQLLQAGWFDGAAGVVLGQFTDCGDAESVLLERLAPLGVPVLTGVAVGHGRPQLTVRLGAPAELDPARGTLTLR